MLRPSLSALVCLRLTLCGGLLFSVGCADDGKSSSTEQGLDGLSDTGGGGDDSSGDDGDGANAAPTAPELLIEPVEPTTESDLEAVFLTESTDPDGDTLTLSYSWRVDGTEASDYTEATIPAEATSKGEVWEVEVVADDGSATSEAAIASTTILNTPPELDSAGAGLDGSTARESLTCTPGDTRDVDGDSVTLRTAWFVDGAEVAEGETLEPGFHVRDSEVFCRVTPNDGEEDGEPVDSNLLVIGNSEPEVVEVLLAPTSPTTNDTVASTVTVDEPDGDSLAYTYSWYVNDGLAAVGSDSLSGVDYFAKNDRVYLEVMVNDGSGDSAIVRSNEVLVLNTAPVGDSVSLSPSAPGTSDDIVATAVGTDDDADTLTWTYAWYVDGSLVSGETSDTLPSSYTSANDSVYVVATPNDGEVDGSSVTSSTLTVLNTAPTVDSVTLGPASPTTDEVLTVTVTGSDADGDSLTYSYAWSVDGAAISATGSTLDGATWFSKDQTVSVEVTANDGTDDSLGTLGDSILILNTAPESTSVSLSSSAPTTDETLTASPAGSDADGDTLSWTYTWYVNGTEVSGESGSSLDSSYTSAGDTIYVVATPSDGTDSGAEVTSSTATVANSAPVASSVTFSSSMVYTNDLMTAVPSGTDADGDTLSWSYVWYVNGVEVSGETSSTLDGASHFDRDDTVYVVATPTDGTDAGSSVTSSTLTVLNTAPEDAVIAIDPVEPLVTEDLFCEVTTPSTDADGDGISYTISWDVNGTAFTGASTTTYTGDTIDSGDTSGDDVWTCTVTPTDGTDSAATVTDSVTVIEWTGPRELTTCGASGVSGPSQSDCDTEYGGSTLDGEVIVSGGVQEWEVPFDGDFVITAYGAQGASGDSSFLGGWGAMAEGTFTLTAGDILYIAVGQIGSGQSLNSNGAGGGGTFVVDSADTPLVVAGGGGGTRTAVSQDGCDAVASEYGVVGSGSATTSSCTVKSSSLGSGGSISSYSWGSGGAGFYGDGDSEADYVSWGGSGGYSWANGLEGGKGSTGCGHDSAGGFGGGGSGDGCYGGGGGGGYSGGDGGRVAGGGGSYVDSSATDDSKSGAYNEGDGWVIIDVAD